MNIVDENGVKAKASKIARKPCGRCGTSIEGNEFCLECLDFFRGLSGRKVLFPTTMRRDAETLIGSQPESKRANQ
jgi:hypothetical protein